jgi:branched-chain amino acid transport system permease protein
VFGTGQQPVQLPAYLRGRVEYGDFSFGIYRMFLVAAALVITGLLVLGLEYTRFGSRVRACVDNQRMARGLGLNVDAVFSITFALGSGLAGLGGALGIEIVGLDPNFAFKYLVYMLIVVAVGGLASIRGAFVTAAMLGIIDIVSKYYVPEIGAFVLYFVMVSFLVWRPAGLFVRRS